MCEKRDMVLRGETQIKLLCTSAEYDGGTQLQMMATHKTGKKSRRFLSNKRGC